MPAPGFLGTLARHGTRPALVTDAGTSVTYADLDRLSRAFATQTLSPPAHATRSTASPVQRALVAVEAVPTVPSIVGLLGALAAGHAVALLPPDDPAAGQAFADAFSPDLTWRETGGRWRLERHAPPAGPALHPDLALLLLTSGSTGRPRAVRLSATALDANAGAIAGYLGLTPADRAALVLPLHYSYGLSVLTSHLAAGASLYLHPGSVLDPGFTGMLRAAGATSLAGVPWTFELLERIGFREAVLPDLRTMTVAGGRMAPERIRQYDTHLRARHGRLFVMYGQTEATARIAYLPPERAATHPDCIGTAIPGGELLLLDEDGGRVTASGTPAELAYRGPNVMMGYAETRADLARGPEIDTLRTGDIAERTPDGLYRILGRRRRMSKIAGLRLSHDALEAALTRDGIAAAVTGDDTTLIAAYEGTADPDRVLRSLTRATALPPTRLRVLPPALIPRLASGKPDYETIRRRAAATRTRDPEGDVTADFRAVFHPAPVTAGDSFLSLGGDSLRHVELAMLLERRLGTLPARWERTPVATLAALPAAAGRTSAVATEHIVRAAAILLVVIQHATLAPIPIGSTAMMLLIGFSLARYRMPALAGGRTADILRPLGAALVPYYLLVAGYALAWGQIPWASVFLAGNLGFGDPVNHTMIPYLYWFVEAYAQLLLLAAAAFAIPAVRRAATTNPFHFGLAALAAAMALRLAFPVLYPLAGRQIFSLPWVLPMATLGWCAATADTPRRRWLTLAAAAATLPTLAWLGGNWTGAWIRYGAQGAILAALLYIPAVRLPRPLASATLTVAAAAFTLYLTHRFAPELLLAGLEPHMSAPAFALLAIASGTALGLALHEARRGAARLWRRRAQPTTAMAKPSQPFAPTV